MHRTALPHFSVNEKGWAIPRCGFASNNPQSTHYPVVPHPTGAAHPYTRRIVYEVTRCWGKRPRAYQRRTRWASTAILRPTGLGTRSCLCFQQDARSVFEAPVCVEISSTHAKRGPRLMLRSTLQHRRQTTRESATGSRIAFDTIEFKRGDHPVPGTRSFPRSGPQSEQTRLAAWAPKRKSRRPD